MEYASEDILQPDESRPAKRVRLEAPLHVTEETQEEMEILDDGDDWNDIYGDAKDQLPSETNAQRSESKGADDFGSGAQLSPQLDHDVSSSTVPSSATLEPASGGTLNLAPVGERAETSKDANSAEQTQLAAADGVPVEAIDQGPDLIDEQHHAIAATDKPDVRMVEEISAINENENPVLDGLEEAINQDQRFMQPPAQQLGVEPHLQDEDTDLRNTKVPNKVTEDREFMDAAAAQKGTKTAEWQFDSSDAESSSDSDSDSDSDSEDSDDSEGGYEMLDPATAAKMLMQGDGEDDEGDKGKKSNGDRQPRTANEIRETIIPKPDVIVTDDMKVTELGVVERAVENMLLIKGSTPGEYQVLESGSVLCNEKREVVGAVLETLGRVQAPLYSVQFTNAQDIEDAGLKHGVKIYYVESHSTFVFTQPLKNLKGTDASNIHDEEVGEEEMEFSDDEAEAEYKRQKKQAKKAGRGGMNPQAGRGGSRSFDTFGHDVGTSFVNASDAPRQDYGGGMSYDDEPSEDFYSPLKRPDNLGDMMAGGGVQQSHAQPGNSDRGRGRGRGERGRGRGDRGRGRGDRGRGRGGFDNARGGDRGRGRGNSDGQRGNDRGRGNGGPQNSHRGNAQSFPDRHNNEPRPAPIQHGLPPKPEVGHYSPPAVQQPTPSGQFQQPAPSTYQFNGYTFQHGVQPSHQPQPPTYFPQQHQPLPPAAPFTAGSYVNPAYYQAQQSQQQAQWSAQHGQYATPQMQAPASAPYPAVSGQQMYQQGGPAVAGYDAVPSQQQQTNLAEVLRRLGAQP